MVKERLRWWLDIATTAAILVTCGILIWFLFTTFQRQPSRRAFTLPATPVSIDGAHRVGDRSASTVLLVYSDFVCPYCARFAREDLPRIRTAYVNTGKLEIVFRQLPLKTLHPTAMQAAVAAECVGRRGRFWEMHDLLFANQRDFDEEHFLKWSLSVGVAESQYRECAAQGMSRELAEAVERDVAEATAAGISATPTFVLGRRQRDDRVKLLKVVQAMPFSQLASEIEGAVGGRN